MTILWCLVKSYIICLIALGFCYAQIPPASSGAETGFSVKDFEAFAKWAGGDVSRFDITQDTLSEFLDERRKQVGIGGTPKWNAWLKNMEASPSLELRAWALARRLEGGDLSGYNEYAKMLFEYALSISKPGYSEFNIETGLGHDRIAPSPLNIHSDSIFWRIFENTIRKDDKLPLSQELYAIWCFNTHPKQRELIFDLAKNVLLKDGKGTYAFAWSDPRFWIVMDWLYSWGDEDDFIKVLELLPKKAKSVFSNLFKEARKLPGFLSSKLQMPGETPDFSDYPDIAVKHRPMGQRFPDEARLRGLMTTLELEIIIDNEGKPKTCRPRPGPWQAFFAPTGINYAMRWEFEPTKIDGKPVERRFLIRLNFRM